MLQNCLEFVGILRQTLLA